MTTITTPLPAAATALLPADYEAARTALAKCARVDECKDWADRAVALASHAKRAEDRTLETMAQRIRARAIRRAGELLREFGPEQGARDGKPEAGAHTPSRGRGSQGRRLLRPRRDRRHVARLQDLGRLPRSTRGRRPDPPRGCARSGTTGAVAERPGGAGGRPGRLGRTALHDASLVRCSAHPAQAAGVPRLDRLRPGHGPPRPPAFAGKVWEVRSTTAVTYAAQAWRTWPRGRPLAHLLPTVLMAKGGASSSPKRRWLFRGARAVARCLLVNLRQRTQRRSVRSTRSAGAGTRIC